MSRAIEYINGLLPALAGLDDESVENVCTVLWRCWRSERKLMICGNGGSAATASHIVADLSKGLMLDCDRAMDARCLSDNAAFVTAWSNDLDYNGVFSGQVCAYISEYDYLLAISGSGNSINVIDAVEAANKIGATTIGLSGMGGGKLAQVAKHNVIVPSDDMQIVEDVHLSICHMIFRQLRDRWNEDRRAGRVIA